MERLPEDRHIQLGADLVADSMDPATGTLHISIRSIKIYPFGSKDPIGQIAVRNDNAPVSSSNALVFSTPPIVNDIFRCAEVLSSGEFEDKDRIVETCVSTIRDHDRQLYNNTEELYKLHSNDANGPFFSRGGVFSDAAGKSRLSDWAQHYVAAAKKQPITYIPYASESVPEGTSFLAVGHPANTTGKGISGILEKYQIRPEQITFAGALGNVKVVFVLPNLAQLYSVVVSRERMKKNASSGLTKTKLELGYAQNMQDDDGNTILAIQVRPLSASIEGDNGTTLGSRDFGDILNLGEQPKVASQPEKVPRPLDYALIDLLTIKSFGPKLPREAVAYMVTRRWLYERSNNSSFDRYFKFGRPQPNADEAAAQAQNFMSWASAHAPSLPLNVTTSGTLDVSRGLEKIQWDLLPCFKSSLALLASDLGSDMGDNGQLGMCRRAGGNTSEANRKACDMAQTRLQYRRMVKPFGSQCQSTETRLGFDDPFKAFVSFDKDLPTPQVTVLGGREKVSADITLTIASVDGVAHNPRSGVIAERSDFEARGDAPSAVQPFAMFTVRLANVAYTDSRTGAPVAVLADAPPQAPGEPTQTAGIPAPPNTIPPLEPYGPDIVGLRIGMSFEAAETVIRGHMKVGAVLEGSRLHDEQEKRGFIKPVDSGKLFISDDGKEMIALIDEPPSAAGRVMLAWRRLYIPTGTILPSEIDVDASKKYGTHSGRGTLANAKFSSWSPIGGIKCAGFYETTRFFPLSNTWYDNGQPTQFNSSNPGGMRSPRMPVGYFDPTNREFQDAKKCGPEVTINFLKSGGPMDEVDTLLEDFGHYANAYAASRQQLRDENPGASPQSHVKF